jgi:hypothetical protein
LRPGRFEFPERAWDRYDGRSATSSSVARVFNPCASEDHGLKTRATIARVPSFDRDLFHMTQPIESLPPDPADPAQHPHPDEPPPRRHAWLWAVGAVVVIGAVMAITMFPGGSRETQMALRQRQQLLTFGRALKQYADQHGGALPEQPPVEITLHDDSGQPIDTAALLADVTAPGRRVTYRAVTESGERLRYAQYGERIVAWTDPNPKGLRFVLYNSLDDVALVRDEDFDPAEQRTRSAAGLNRVRSVESAEPGGEGEESEEPDPTTAPATEPATGPN